MADEAKKTDRDLWEKVKAEVTASDKGGRAGQWSARKAQMAVQEYRRRGGGYDSSGARQEDTHLHQWTEEEWCTRSGKESLESGERYLPRQVRLLLTEEEYARSTRDKQSADGQFSEQPEDIRKKAAAIRKRGPTRKMLVQRAAELEISGRSGMSNSELLDAIDEATDDDRRALGTRPALAAMRGHERGRPARHGARPRHRGPQQDVQGQACVGARGRRVQRQEKTGALCDGAGPGGRGP